MDMTMFETVDLAPALKFTAVLENEPDHEWKTYVRHLCPRKGTLLLPERLQQPSVSNHIDHLLPHNTRTEIQQRWRTPSPASPCCRQVCTLLQRRKIVQRRWLPRRGRGNASFLFQQSAFQISPWNTRRTPYCIQEVRTVRAMTAQMTAILAHSVVCGPFRCICLTELGFKPACTFWMILTPCLSALVA